MPHISKIFFDVDNDLSYLKRARRAIGYGCFGLCICYIILNKRKWYIRLIRIVMVCTFCCSCCCYLWKEIQFLCLFPLHFSVYIIDKTFFGSYKHSKVVTVYTETRNTTQNRIYIEFLKMICNHQDVFFFVHYFMFFFFIS